MFLKITLLLIILYMVYLFFRRSHHDLQLAQNIINAKIVFDNLTDENKDTFSFYAARILVENRYSPSLTDSKAVDIFEKFDIYKKLSLLALVFLEQGIPPDHPIPQLNVWHVVKSPLAIPERVYKLIDRDILYLSEKYNLKITLK